MKPKVQHIVADEAKAVERDAEGLAYLWLAEHTEAAIRYVSLARLHSSDEIHLERDDQAWSCHDGLQQISLGEDGIEILLNRNGAKSLGGVTRLSVAFGPDAKALYKQVDKVLRVICAKQPALLSRKDT